LPRTVERARICSGHVADAWLNIPPTPTCLKDLVQSFYVRRKIDLQELGDAYDVLGSATSLAIGGRLSSASVRPRSFAPCPARSGALAEYQGASAAAWRGHASVRGTLLRGRRLRARERAVQASKGRDKVHVGRGRSFGLVPADTEFHGRDFARGSPKCVEHALAQPPVRLFPWSSDFSRYTSEIEGQQKQLYKVRGPRTDIVVLEGLTRAMPSRTTNFRSDLAAQVLNDDVRRLTDPLATGARGLVENLGRTLERSTSRASPHSVDLPGRGFARLLWSVGLLNFSPKAV